MTSSNGSFPYDGMGFAIQNSGIVFIDLDHVRNPETGEIAQWAIEAVAAIGSYTELSPSGDGLHVYTLGKLPGKGTKSKFSDGSAMEMYAAGRFTTVTGSAIANSPDDLRTSDVQLLYQCLKN